MLLLFAECDLRTGDIDGYIACERLMYRTWKRFLKLKPDETELAPFVRQKMNPYTGQKVHLKPKKTAKS
jgi:hypothetical protein